MMAAMVWCGCRKENIQPAPNSISTNGNTGAVTTNPASMPAAQQSAITYRLITIQKLTPGILQWHTGYLATAAISIEGFQLAGNAIMRQYAESKAVQNVKLFTSGNLGTLILPYGTYNGINCNLALNPGNSADNNVLFLSGNFMSSNGVEQIELIVAEPMDMTAQISSDVKTTLSNTQYTALLTLNLDGLMNGITTPMLDQAIVQNGVLLISANSNPNLYRLVVNNIKTSLRVEMQ